MTRRGCRLLLLASIRFLEEKGMTAVVATAGSIVSLRLLKSAGFRIIDPPEKTTLHPEAVLTNVGLVCGTRSHVEAQERCGMEPYLHAPVGEDSKALVRYFEAREQEILTNPVAHGPLEPIC